MMDGFEVVDEEFLQTGAIHNVEPYINSYSPFSEMHRLGSPASGPDFYIDTYYGLIFEDWIERGGAPYGITGKFPKSFLGDDVSDFLRTPFAAIPYVKTRNRDDVETVLGVIRRFHPKLQLLFRGQTRLYELGRSDETLERLYGEPVREPSLLSSAERHQTNIDEIAPTWSGFLRYNLDLWATAKKDSQLFRYYNELGQDYAFRFLSLAIAQHYGLPSCGLDVTDKQDIALFFALSELKKSGRDNTYVDAAVSESHRPLLFVFGIENISKYIRYDPQILKIEGRSRPQAQSACFLAEGWGMARNKVAQSLIAAIELDPLGDYSPVADATTLFPDRGADILGVAIDMARQNLRNELPGFGEFLGYFYWVEPSAS